MSTLRKTANDYRKEFNNLTEKIKSLEVHLTNRLIHLATTHPDAIVDKIGDTEIKACPSFIHHGYVEHISTEKKINYIASIEKWLADQNPIKQKSIEFK